MFDVYRKLDKAIKGKYLKSKILVSKEPEREIIEDDAKSAYVFMQCERSSLIFEYILENDETIWVSFSVNIISIG